MQTPHGVLLTAKLKALPAGTHAFHVHETGMCEPSFKSPGGHFNPGETKYGLLAEEGYHAGDMPNIHVPDSGELTIEAMNTEITLGKEEDYTVFDDDGSAIVIHEGGDDYKTDSAGGPWGAPRLRRDRVAQRTRKTTRTPMPPRASAGLGLTALPRIRHGSGTRP